MSQRSSTPLGRALARRLKAERYAQCRGTKEVANAAGMFWSGLCRIERGGNDISLSVLADLCKALGVRPSEMLARAEDDAARAANDITL